MMTSTSQGRSGGGATKLLIGLSLTCAVAFAAWKYLSLPAGNSAAVSRRRLNYVPRQSDIDPAGLNTVTALVVPWGPTASLEEIGRSWQRVGYRNIESIDESLADTGTSAEKRLALQFSKASLYNYEGEPNRAYEVLERLRTQIEGQDSWAESLLYSVIHFQGVTALRRGETENCIMCRGESSCILPISASAVHTNPEGSRLAIRHFTEYLERFPDDPAVRWLLNLAHMTLGEHPDKVDPRFLISLDRFRQSEFDIGRFRDIGHLAGVNRFNQAGGAIMEDFDNDGLLDLAVTTWDATGPMVLYGNTGAGTFEDRTAAAGLDDQLGGLYCVQTDYNNDGDMDIFIARGAWMRHPMRPSLLRNNGNGTFTDVTLEAGLLEPLNSNSACWADYDNDGWLDVFVCCELQTNRLYHNLGNGTFQEVSLSAGVAGRAAYERAGSAWYGCKGAAWIDCDNDGYQDLFVNYLTTEGGQLYRNNRDGTFADASVDMSINGPAMGFSCWAWDYDNDGWLDIFATSFDRSVGDMVNGLVGQPHTRHSSRLYRNQEGRGFDDKTSEAGLDMVFAAMGSNFGDFDNDGYLDMYLGTGDFTLEFLAPNRMFKNVGGRRFAEITGSSGTGNLQKGHGVACGDWDRDGDSDIFIEMGGATPGDRYHNILFQNPGQGNHWLTVKLVGRKTNRPAIGARIKVVTSGDEPQTVHRHVSSGSSFGANPLQQTIGVGKAGRIASLEVHWPASQTTQIFRDLAADQAIEITEFADDYRKLDWTPIATPAGSSGR